MPSYSRWCPPELTDAAQPLSQVHRLLQALCEEHAGIEGLVPAGPAHDAVVRFLDAYAQAAFDLGSQSGELAYNLRLAADSYRYVEQDLTDRVFGDRP